MDGWEEYTKITPDQDLDFFWKLLTLHSQSEFSIFNSMTKFMDFAVLILTFGLGIYTCFLAG